MLQYSDGTSNKMSNIIKRHIDNRELLLICILQLSHALIFFRFIFYQYLVVLLFNPLNAELNPICHLLALLGGATIVVVSRLRVNTVIYIFLL